ncbi:hypothetical protein BZA05DRAFT_8446 [Tricharina praecox]|uniref:uncharacterized protein n=1 Tax=Tricharina praecox TaxID=43433 RepID=UPI00221EC116|nr:uncharacterized protein BZA05DRAFT_8446 [Tricharina praecox]KAI5858595.1 hypothetical protein BZA05DRAFT_8446 [Tricharina praecox]
MSLSQGDTHTTNMTPQNPRMTRLQVTLSANNKGRVEDGSAAPGKAMTDLLESDSNSPRLRAIRRTSRNKTANKDLPKGTSKIGAKRGIEAVELNIFSKPKRQKTTTARAVGVHTPSKLGKRKFKDEPMDSESEELSDLEVKHGSGVSKKPLKVSKTKDSLNESLWRSNQRPTGTAASDTVQPGDNDRVRYDFRLREPSTFGQGQTSTIKADARSSSTGAPSVRKQTMLWVGSPVKGTKRQPYHAPSSKGIAEKGCTNSTLETPELVKAGVSHEFYSKVESNIEGSVHRLDETLTYLLATRQDGSSIAETPFKQYFANKKASLTKKLDFLVDNIAAYCHDGTTVKYKAWKKNGCPQFNGIPVLARPVPRWEPIEEGSKKSRNVTSGKPTSHANTSGKEPASTTPPDTTEVPGTSSKSPIVVDDSLDSQDSQDPNESDEDHSSTRSSPTRETEEADRELHGLTGAENERLRDHCIKRGALLESCFHTLCDRLNIPQPHNNSQIRGLGFTPKALAREFLLEFPNFCEPVRVSVIRVGAFLESVFSHHLSGPDFYRTTSPQGLPTPDPTPETESSVGSVDAATSPSVAQGPASEANIELRVDGENEDPHGGQEEIPLASNKKPRKRKRSTAKESLSDDYLYEQRLIWQRNAWNSTRPLEYVAAARGDRAKLRFLHRQREITLLKQQERDIADELQEQKSKKVKTDNAQQVSGSPPSGWQLFDAVAATRAMYSQRKLQFTTEIATDEASKQLMEEDEGSHHQWKPLPYRAQEDKAERLRGLADWAKVVDEPVSPLPAAAAPRKRKKYLRKRRGW